MFIIDRIKKLSNNSANKEVKMPKPVDGIDRHMRTIIILDPLEVIFNNTSDLIRQQSIKENGPLKTRALFTCKKLGIFKKYVNKHIAKLTANQTIRNSKILPGAEEALKIFSSFGNGTLTVIACSDINDKNLAAKLTEHYSNIPCMSFIEDYRFSTTEESKYEILSNIKIEFLRGNVVSVETNVKGVGRAKDEGVIPVLITENVEEWVSSVRYKSMCEKKLADFAKKMEVELRC